MGGGVSGQRHTLAALPPGRRPGTDFVRDEVSPTTGLDGCRKSPPPLTGVRSTDIPDSSESCHRLHHVGYTCILRTLNGSVWGARLCVIIVKFSSSSSAVCLTTGPHSPPKRLHTVRFYVSSFNFQYFRLPLTL